MVAGLLPIVLDSSRAPHLEHFLRFLSTVSKPRVTFDEWTSFLSFQSVSVDLSGYDEDGACTHYMSLLFYPTYFLHSLLSSILCFICVISRACSPGRLCRLETCWSLTKCACAIASYTL